MAKVKQTKSLQERLEDAIVPKEQAPFAIPENWCWVRLGNLSSIKTGKHDANHATENGFFRFYTCSSNYSFCNTYLFDGEAVIVPGNGDIGLVFYYAGKFDAYQRTYVIYNFFGSTKYLYYYFYYMWRKRNEDKLFGTAIPYVRLANLTEFEIPFAPLEEQQKIVDKIESLFSKLDEAKELIQKSLDEFEDRRAAVLYDAFHGDLTKNWRKRIGKVKDYKLKKFCDVATIQSNLVNPLEYPDMPHIAPDNIEKYTGRLLDYHTISEDKVISGKHRFYAGQILYSKIRPNLSKVIIAEFDGLCSADMYPIKAKENTKYLFYFMLSNEFLEQATTAGSRSVLPKINQKELSNLNIIIPSVEEQQEIVRILDSFFEKEDKSKEFLDMIDQIEEMKKSILSRAFRGELGTHSDTDEPAVEFVKKIVLNN